MGTESVLHWFCGSNPDGVRASSARLAGMPVRHRIALPAKVAIRLLGEQRPEVPSERWRASCEPPVGPSTPRLAGPGPSSVPPCLQWFRSGQTADSAGVPRLWNSTAGLQHPVRPASRPGTCSGSACQPATCDANQQFERLPSRPMAITDALPALCLGYTVLLRCVCLVHG